MTARQVSRARPSTDDSGCNPQKTPNWAGCSPCCVAISIRKSAGCFPQAKADQYLDWIARMWLFSEYEYELCGSTVSNTSSRGFWRSKSVVPGSTSSGLGTVETGLSCEGPPPNQPLTARAIAPQSKIAAPPIARPQRRPGPAFFVVT